MITVCCFFIVSYSEEKSSPSGTKWTAFDEHNPAEISYEDWKVESVEAGEDTSEPAHLEAGKFGALPPRTEWAYEFSKVRKELLSKKPLCEACGASPEEVGPLNAHHVISVKRIEEEGLDPALKTDINNLIVLCRGGQDCHLKYGHGGNFSTSNPHVRRDSAKHFSETWPGWTYSELCADYLKTNQAPSEPMRKRSRDRKTQVAP